MHKVLNYIAQRYNNPPIYVTENGMLGETFLGKKKLNLEFQLWFNAFAHYINEICTEVKYIELKFF